MTVEEITSARFQGLAGTAQIEGGNGVMTWAEWQASREAKRAVLRKYGVDAPSRRTVSYNTSERFMRQEFGGGRIPAWAKEAE